MTDRQKEHTMPKLRKYKERRPQVVAVEIPSPCTMADADAIERQIRVKRADWDASANEVRAFDVDGNRARPGDWIVATELRPGTGVFDHAVVHREEFDRRYKEMRGD